MLTRLILCKVTILATVLTSLPVSQARVSAVAESSIRISSYQDDPFVGASNIERIDGSGFNPDATGRLILFNKQASIIDDAVVYREDPKTGDYVAFANNPWPQPTSNEKGHFKFSNEERFPLHEIERGPDGKPLLDENGLQMWKPRDLHLGMTTVFEAANVAKDAAEFWSGRNIDWGEETGILPINSHAFIDFNAFFSPSAQGLFFGVVPYRLPGRSDVRIFEMGTSWEVAAHECGHALHGVLKPNRIWSDKGYKVWGESFGDQLEMWASLRDRRRARSLLTDTNGDLNQSNALTRIAEVLGSLIGEDTSLRDCFHDKKVSNTSSEDHARSEVLTGAAYKFFLQVYSSLKSEQRMGAEEALEVAGDIMGTFLIRCVDYTPENSMTLEDIAKAYLKVDKEFYGSRYRESLVDEFTKRELFDAHSLDEWLAHEAAVPDLRLPRRTTEKAMDNMLQASLDKLGIGPEFGLKLQSLTRENRFAQTIIRVQLTEGRGSDAVPLENHGILIFRTDGTLADYHSPLASDGASEMRLQAQAEARSLMDRAKQLSINHRGAPLSIIRRPDGQLTVEARVMRSKGFYCWAEVFTLENPQGERREIITRPVPKGIGGLQPSGVQILTADDLQER